MWPRSPGRTSGASQPEPFGEPHPAVEHDPVAPPPIASGSDVVGAATTAPVVSDVIALSERDRALADAWSSPHASACPKAVRVPRQTKAARADCTARPRECPSHG
jgi:hypothetical protein